ncbi:SLAP domain-containing protein [Piscibacillus halophilus]|uniref:SLAP domain-containing protein n=1 Tax=Piscibacillus halophilus TaxID=571933 RepID=A0A1H9IWX3_9BACI|nr:SLAP domain-containing protein [Piscibacillus halophilus]SEQ79113.1 SLAP domain-containing protein [Piscibacillus halophilus]
MQQLQFEEKWDKTLSEQDRRKIEEVFDETKDHNELDFEPVTLWHANNHKNELLVTVLLHNRATETKSFENVHVVYKTLDEPIAEHDFNVPRLNIPPNTSMPWTFIFPNVKVDDPTLGILLFT